MGHSRTTQPTSNVEDRIVDSGRSRVAVEVYWPNTMAGDRRPVTGVRFYDDMTPLEAWDAHERRLLEPKSELGTDEEVVLRAAFVEAVGLMATSASASAQSAAVPRTSTPRRAVSARRSRSDAPAAPVRTIPHGRVEGSSTETATSVCTSPTTPGRAAAATCWSTSRSWSSRLVADSCPTRRSITRITTARTTPWRTWRSGCAANTQATTADSTFTSASETRGAASTSSQVVA